MRVSYSHFLMFSLSLMNLLSTAYASDSQLTIINHFNHPLRFVVGTNVATLPDLHEVSVPVNGQTHTRVVDNQLQAYVRVDPLEFSKSDYAFFGVKNENSQAIVRGYLSSGIAFSWIQNQSVTFCTPEVYKTKHAC